MPDSAAIDRTSRRDLLRVGALTPLGVTLSGLLARESAAATAKSTNCILLWMLGGPSHIDMYDLKPDAPAEIRGELNPIQTRIAGVELSELMPNLAGCNDKFSLIRSMQSYTSSHGMGDHHLLSGRRYSKEFTPPSFGSVMTWQRAGQKTGGVPPFVQVGDMKSTNFGRQGQAGALGHKYDPFLVERDPNSSSFQVEAFSTPDSIGIQRLADRQSLLRSVDRFQSRGEQQLPFAETHSAFTEQAFDLLTSQKAKQAFDIEQEPPRVRDAYGRNRVGQGLLLARRLIESGVRFVTVKGYVRYGWDHHPEVFPRLRTEVPPYDQGYAALLKDLDDRGMLENTLVITAGEFGRTPRLNSDARGPGRDHWSRAFSLTIGGGGVRTGVVIGATDKHAAEISDRPVSVEDYAATVYHALGMNPGKVYPTLDGRPTVSLPAGDVIPELIR
ncbi:MAG: DUF1501 domain-containing protein [Pirellulaceae bacterium]|jgi:hypothetical protein|nr:DUF1501 domain-containing protein [Pirellulaceae bacterium]MDP7018218.1 DUF1501 domain-containing protein [Pirellulaceae bacterium]